MPEKFSFRRRHERIDWRKIASVDLEMLSRTLNFTTLQDNILNVAFCDIQSELDLRSVDPNYIKLFQLSQFIIEYLLNSQDYLCTNISQSQQAIDKLTQELDKVKSLDAGSQGEIERIKRESHKRKRIIAAQQRIMQTGYNAFHKCPYCEKAFMNDSFLKAHQARRHPETLIHDCPATRELEVMRSKVIDLDITRSKVTELTRELEQLRAELRLSEQRLKDEMSHRAALESMPTRSQNERELRRHLENFQQEQHRSREEEREAYERELRELNEKKRFAEEALAVLQNKISRGMMAGDGWTDGGGVEERELRKQREEVAKLKEQLLDMQRALMQQGQLSDLRSADEMRDTGTYKREERERATPIRSLGSAPPPPPREEKSGVGVMLPASDDDEDTDGAPLSKRTVDTVDSLSVITPQSAVRQKWLKDALTADLLKQMRERVISQLEIKLKEKGIKPGAETVKGHLADSIIDSLKSDRSLLAEKMPNFFDIRNRYSANIKDQSVELLRKKLASLPVNQTLSTNQKPASSQVAPPMQRLTNERAGNMRAAMLSPIAQSRESNATLSESSGRWDTDEEVESLSVSQTVNQNNSKQMGGASITKPSQQQQQQQPKLKSALKESPRVTAMADSEDLLEESIQSLSYNSLQGSADLHRSADGGPLIGVGEPSTSVWNSNKGGAKKLKNSVTFSDDLESTDGGVLTSRDL